MKTRSAFSHTPFALALAFFLTLCLLKIGNAPLFDWNGRRLVGPIATATGLNPYALNESGDAYIAGVNGAITLLLLSPIAWVKNPNQAIYLGMLIMLICFFVPAFWLLQIALKNSPTWLRQSAVALFGFLAFHSKALSVSSGIIHADAPALGFAALAIGMLIKAIQKESRLLLFYSLCLATLSVNCKVTFIPILGAIPFAIAFTQGSREFWRATALSCLLFIASQVLAAGYFGWDSYLHQTWTSLVTFPWVTTLNSGGPAAISLGARLKTLLAVFNEIYQEYWWYLVSLSMALGWKLTQNKSWKFSLSKTLTEPWALCTWVALFLLPPSLMGRAKGGGAMNTQSPFVYFLVLAFALLLCELANRLEVRAGKKARLATLTLVLFVCATQGITSYSLLHFLPTVQANPHQVSFAFAKAHPGQVFFPEFPLSTYYSDKRFYHSGVTAAEIEGTGVPISQEDFRRGVPARARWVAFYGGAHQFVMDRLPDFQKEVRLEALPGWTVFERGDTSDGDGLPVAAPTSTQKSR